MKWLNHLLLRRKLYSELSAEIREHLEEKIEELTAQGMSREQATHVARREFGNITLTEETSRDVWRWSSVEDLFLDARYALRVLRKNPGFTTVAVVTLALGIAANTTIFSAVNGWMLRRPRIKDPARVVAVVTTPGYLRTLEIPLIRGRSFLSSDSAQALPVALVNEAFVRRYFPNEDSIGKRLRLDTDSLDRPNWSEIVGVVGDVRGSFDQRKYVPQVYESYPQNSSSVMTLVLRTGSNPAAFAPMLRRAVWSLDKDQPITAVQTMNEVMVQSGAGMWVTNILIGTFAGLGLALAAVGVFAVMAYAVAQRTHEIGIRMALGARRTDVLRILIEKGMVLGAVGIGSGLALAAPLVWFKLGLVNDDFMPFDQRGPVFLAAVLLIWLTALLASYVPALRAMRVDPTVALRHE